MIFYKGVLVTDLEVKDYIPGTVTINIWEAQKWVDQIQTNKHNGKSRHSRKGIACIIEINFPEDKLLLGNEFQRSGVSEHSRISCWTSNLKTKAQINTAVNFKILSSDETEERLFPILKR